MPPPHPKKSIRCHNRRILKQSGLPTAALYPPTGLVLSPALTAIANDPGPLRILFWHRIAQHHTTAKGWLLDQIKAKPTDFSGLELMSVVLKPAIHVSVQGQWREVLARVAFTLSQLPWPGISRQHGHVYNTHLVMNDITTGSVLASRQVDLSPDPSYPQPRSYVCRYRCHVEGHHFDDCFAPPSSSLPRYKFSCLNQLNLDHPRLYSRSTRMLRQHVPAEPLNNPTGHGFTDSFRPSAPSQDGLTTEPAR
ncbi:unnamed protein product [Protopolystoma xenopodis]|uniref:Uncharacterized protein n=1 Tax=Protopolystoma xenopodis TaxID=117903 RepID=A0A3S5FGX5_9PLAT|nr:unnamed protein product [Protopolystoma xenopodis]